MSDVIRATRTPVFSFEKKSSDSDCRCANTPVRRSRRKPSPALATSTIDSRPNTNASAAMAT